MAIETPIMKWPFRLGTGNAAIQFVEQDTPIEIAQCVGFLYATQPGEVISSNSFGLDDPAFKMRGVSASELHTAAARFEPRAVVTLSSDVLTSIAQTVGITVET